MKISSVSKVLSCFAILFFASSNSSVNLIESHNHKDGSTRIIREKRHAAENSEIMLLASGIIFLTQGNENSICIETDDNIINEKTILTTKADTLSDLLKEGDKNADEVFDNEKALKIYLQADKLSPNNWDIYWRISKVYMDLGEDTPVKTDEQKDIQIAKYNTALNYAEKAVKLAPDKSVTYLRRALVNAKFTELKGFPSAIGLVKRVREDLEMAIKIGNGGNIIQSFSHYVLGRVHAEVSQKPYLIRLPLGLGWADDDIAEAEYKKAIELRSNFREYFLYLGILYLDKEEYKKAKDSLVQLEKFPIQDKDDNNFLGDAKKILISLKAKGI